MLQTAGVIEKRPWAMTVAAEYLRALADNNRRAAIRTNVPDISWVRNPSLTTDLGSPADAILEDLNEPNVRRPQRVRITGKRGGA